MSLWNDICGVMNGKVVFTSPEAGLDRIASLFTTAQEANSAHMAKVKLRSMSHNRAKLTLM